MKSIIIEDEKQSAEHLNILINKHYPKINVLAKLRSVEESIEWFNSNTEPDLIFIDIELSDGTCFEILEAIKTNAKLVFTTAYDEHAIRAFEFNSIAYLLKPINFDKLKGALDKIEFYKTYHSNDSIFNEIKALLTQKEYKQRFLVKRGDKFWHIPVNDIAFFASEEGLTVAYLSDFRKFFIDHSLDELENMLYPKDFFRINRKFILNINSIQTVKTYFTRRLLLETEPKYAEDIIVSKERVNSFKRWLDS